MTSNSIAQTITEGTQVRMVYKSVESGITERIVDVERVWTCKSSGGTAFVGFCYSRNAKRTFNMANVLFATKNDASPFVTFASDPPPGILDSESVWSAIDYLNLPEAQYPWDEHSARHMLAGMQATA